MGRPRRSGPEALANLLSDMSQEERRAHFLETAAGLFKTKSYAGTREVFQSVPEDLSVSERIGAWTEANRSPVERTVQVLSDVNRSFIFRLNAACRGSNRRL